MTREQLEHAIRAACEIVGDTEVYVFGSQSILGQHPDVPSTLKMSAEADISPKHRIDRVSLLDSIGEDSRFHRTHGFYVHGLPIDEAAVLPAGWTTRTITVQATASSIGLCLDGHDLAASKLVAFRDKDREFVATLLEARLLGGRTLVERVWLLPLAYDQRLRIVKWVDITVQELD